MLAIFFAFQVLTDSAVSAAIAARDAPLAPVQFGEASM